MPDKKDDKKPVKVQDLSPKKDAKGGARNVDAARNPDATRSPDGSRNPDGNRNLDGGMKNLN
jgi:hypothetical protein